MAVCRRRSSLASPCFILLFLLAYFLFSKDPKSNYTKLQSLGSGESKRKLVLDQISVSVTNEAACPGHGQQVLLLVLVTSHAGNYRLRQRARREFNSSVLEMLQVRRVFLIGQTPAERFSSAATNDGKFTIPSVSEIAEESSVWQDLVIGSFVEAYRNLTYKHLLGLRWAVEHCSRATFLLKQDDDIFVDLFGLVNKLGSGGALGSVLGSGSVIYGKALENRPVIRNAASKWFVTKDEFRGAEYPAFVSGWAYLTTLPAIHKILQVAQGSDFFWVDDVFITGVLREAANIDLIDGSESFAVTRTFFQCCSTITTKSVREKASLWCDFLFGPQPLDRLRFRLISQSQHCYTSGGCSWRSPQESLLKTCVITNQEAISGGELPHNKGRPLLEPLKLSL